MNIEIPANITPATPEPVPEPAPKRKRRKWPYILLLLIVLIATALALFWDRLPYQNAAARKIENVIRSYGVEVVSLKVDSINSNHAVLKDIQLGTAHPLRIKEISVDYDIQEVATGKLNSISVKGLEGELYQENGEWKLGGMENYRPRENRQGNARDIFFNLEELRNTLPASIKVAESNFTLKGEKAQVVIPVEFTAIIAETLAVHAKLTSLDLNVKPHEVTAGTTSLEAVLSADNEWTGTINGSAIAVKSGDMIIPPLALTGKLLANIERIAGNITLKSNDATHEANASLTLPFDKHNDGRLIVENIRFPWKDGTIAAESVQVALDGKSPIRVPVELRELGVGPLLDTISKGRIQGTGKISGIQPVIYHPGGKITLEEGSALATETGTITVAPELLPAGDRAELAILQQALQNFNYSLLKIQLLSDAEETKIQMTLEGNNPNAFEGKPIKLNQNFTGDIMPLIQQSLLPFNDLEQLMKNQKPNQETP